MTNSEIQDRYDHLIRRVNLMRYYQKEYIKYRVESDKQTMIRLQREIDNILSVELKRMKSKQQELL